MKRYIALIALLLISYSAKCQSDSVAVAQIKGETYKAVLKSNGSLSILTHKGKVIFLLKSKDLYDEDFWRLRFEDFDTDGYKDLLISYRSNVPGRQDLILFDNHQMRFVQIKDFPDYPAAIHLKGTDLFYSYHRSGCADEDWDSDLFKFRILKL